MRNGSSIGALPSCSVLSIRVDKVRQDELERRVVHSVTTHKRDVFAYLNIHAINLARKDERLAFILRTAAVAYCDGEGVRLGARMLGIELPPRIVLTTWIWDLCSIFEREGISVFLLGGAASTVQAAKTNLLKAHPRLRVCGTHHGYFDKGREGSASVIEMINAARPDALFVGFGMPMQEYWIAESRAQLDVGAIFPCGSMIEYVAGTKRPAPAWMARNGFEWLHRLWKEPRRLWKRYLLGNPSFVFHILVHALKRKSER